MLHPDDPQLAADEISLKLDGGEDDGVTLPCNHNESGVVPEFIEVRTRVLEEDSEEEWERGRERAEKSEVRGGEKGTK